jgi:hypothetical protein
MKFLKDNLGLILAGSYAVLMSVVLFFDFQSLGNNFWSKASLLLTMPWSIGIAFIAFGLIHISSYGLEYGFTFCALLNTVIFYLFGRAVSRRNT